MPIGRFLTATTTHIAARSSEPMISAVARAPIIARH